MKKIILVSLSLGILLATGPVLATIAPPPMTPPVITLIGANPAEVYVGAVYTDAGSTAVDNTGANISSLITVSGLPVNTPAVGTFTVTYNVTDSFGLSAVPVTRTVNVVLPPPPPPPQFPTNKDQCKKGGWMNYGDLFKNQGDCVSFIATGGKNPPSGI
jgi:hypothetical protein